MAKLVPTKALALIAAASASVLLASAPASAQTFTQATAGSLTWAKSDAILGGAPSALEGILARQSGLPVPGAAAPLRPGSYSNPPVVTAAIRFGPSPGAISGRP